jgi:pullulanase/glycogen debranching enzyme
MSGVVGASGVRDVVWLDEFCNELHGDAWRKTERRSLQMLLDARALLLFNGHDQEQHFTLPPAATGAGWRVLVNTAEPADLSPVAVSLTLPALTLVLLQSHGP